MFVNVQPTATAVAVAVVGDIVTTFFLASFLISSSSSSSSSLALIHFLIHNYCL